MTSTVQDLVGAFPIPAIPCGVCKHTSRPVEDDLCTVCVPPDMAFFERDDEEIRRRIETQIYLSNSMNHAKPSVVDGNGDKRGGGK